MIVYDINGSELINAYNLNGESALSLYDVHGNLIDNSDPYIEGRTLIFEDDFDSFDSTKWVYEIGLVRNQDRELQCYRSQNVSFENSCLVLTAIKENYADRTWTSGSISGQTKQEFAYGRIEAKIKFPNINGAFGAFWMLGSNFYKEFVEGDYPVNHGTLWPQCGELDIVETIPGYATSMQANLYSYTGNTLGKGYSQNIDNGKWHIYAVERTEEYIAVYLDNVEFKRWTFADNEYLMQAYRLPMYIILNLAVGLAGGTPSPDTTEMKMYVDWVRVYAPLES